MSKSQIISISHQAVLCVGLKNAGNTSDPMKKH